MTRNGIRCALALACALASSTAGARGGELAPAVTAKIDALFAAHDRDGTPGYAVGVVKDGKLVFARGYGRADLDHNVPITPRTSFHLASLSKQFVAAAVARLILDGKLSLETPVANYFPGIKRFGADLRIKHLIYFTSGLPDYTSLKRSDGHPWVSPYYFTVDEAIATTLGAERLKFKPGAQWDYSNVDYMMLAKIVEQVSGHTLAQVLDQRFFRPWGMADSRLNDDATEVIPNRATGYADRSDPRVREQLASVGIDVRAGDGYVTLNRNSPHYGGSGVFSSVADLAKWDTSLHSDDHSNAAFRTLMLTRMKFEHDKANDAFGLVFGEFRGREMIWFSGGDLDGSTYMARLPAERLTVICLSNLPMGDAQGKATRILELLVSSP